MTADEATTDPVAVIVRLVSQVEYHLDAAQIRNVVCTMMTGRAGRRRLAHALVENPEILRTGRPPAPFAIGKLLLALRHAGARDVAAPRCSGCDRPQRHLASRRGIWCCTTCFARIEPCSACGKPRRVVTLDRHGDPRCQDCPDTDGDPIGELITVVAELEPAVDHKAIVDSLAKSTTRPSGQRRLAWAVTDRPDLLTGKGYEAPAPALLRFIDELIAVGATRVQKPACPRCRRVVALSKLLDGQRICRACFAHAAAVPCTRCGAVREPAARDSDGGPLCPNCLVRDPVNLEDCAGCGKRKMVVTRDADGPRCMNCRPRKQIECGICGRTAIGEISRATGQPWCQRCQQWWARCSSCKTVSAIRGGTRHAPLCAKCVNPDPSFWDRCPTCNLTWQLSPRTCQRCNLAEKVGQVLSDDQGAVSQEMQALHQALINIDRPDTAWVWVSRPKVSALLRQIAADHRSVTHQLLDELPAGKTLHHLRSVLVAVGALPTRDEHLIQLEQWTTAAITAHPDHIGRRILHGYATWHHLRRLRHRARGTNVTHLQKANVKCHVTAATNLLDWLAARNLTLANCTQADLDQWIADPSSQYRDEAGHFIRWAVKNRHATGLTFGAVRWQGPAGPLDSEKRWSAARRLLHDDTLDTGDRFAGLLLLLYAQKIATITQLTEDHLDDGGQHMHITFGTAPIALPEPIAQIARQLVTNRRGKAKTGAPRQVPWLYPGGLPGRPIGDDALGQRLNRIGVNPRQDRSTALFTLATEIPAAILARMLGIHIKVAAQWQQAASGDWTTYAADVAARSSPGTAVPPEISA